SLRELLHTLLGFMKRDAQGRNRQQYLQRGDNAVAGGSYIAADDVTGVFSAQRPALIAHHLDHIPVSHLGAGKRHPQLFETQLKTKIAHERTDNTVAPTPILLLMGCDDVKQFITVDQLAFMIDKNYAVAVADKGNPQIGSHLNNTLL